MALAKTVFSGKGDDALLTQDIYEINDSRTKNAYKSVTVVDKTLSAMTDSIRMKTGGIKGILEKADRAADALAKTVPDALKLKNVIGRGPAGAIEALDNKFVQTLAGNLSISPGLLNNLKVVTDDATQHMRGDFKSISGIANVLQGLGSSQTMSVLNMGDRAGLLSGMIDMVADSGSVEIIEMVKNDASVSELLPTVLESKVGVLAAKTGVAGVEAVASITGYDNLAKDKDVFNKTLKGYSNTGVTMVAYSTEMAKTTQAFDKMDSGWKSIATDSRGIDNLNHFVGLSGDVVTAIKHDDEFGESYLAASFYGTADMGQELKSMYKGAAV